MRSHRFSFNLVAKKGVNQNQLWYITFAVLLLSACGPAPERSFLRDDELSQAPAAQTNTWRDDQVPAFNQAQKKANSAATLAQSAKTEAEWKAVAQHWQEAITLMKAVGKNDPNYAIASQKITEYQKNLAQAQKKTKAAVSSSEKLN
jgi:hypothetical protein